MRKINCNIKLEMFRIVEVFEICICSFCECVLEGNSLDKKDFKHSLNYYFRKKEAIRKCLYKYSEEFVFDNGFYENACIEYELLNRKIEKNVAYECAINAFGDTIYKHKTCSVDAYMHILLSKFLKIYII